MLIALPSEERFFDIPVALRRIPKGTGTASKMLLTELFLAAPTFSAPHAEPVRKEHRASISALGRASEWQPGAQGRGSRSSFIRGPLCTFALHVFVKLLCICEVYRVGGADGDLEWAVVSFDLEFFRSAGSVCFAV